MWYNRSSTNLESLGYKKNKLDICVFNRIEKDNAQITLILHVDDMKITSNSEFNIDQVIAEIEILYTGLTKQRGRIINYIGMTFDHSKHDCVRIIMSNCINEVLEGCTVMAQTPAHSNLFDIRSIEDSPLLADEDRERFHSVTAQLLYLAKRVRPDLLVAVAFLTKQVSAPQKDDQGRLVRAIQYLRETSHMGIVPEGQRSISFCGCILRSAC